MVYPMGERQVFMSLFWNLLLTVGVVYEMVAHLKVWIKGIIPGLRAMNKARKDPDAIIAKTLLYNLKQYIFRVVFLMFFWYLIARVFRFIMLLDDVWTLGIYIGVYVVFILDIVSYVTMIFHDRYSYLTEEGVMTSVAVLRWEKFDFPWQQPANGELSQVLMVSTPKDNVPYRFEFSRVDCKRAHEIVASHINVEEKTKGDVTMISLSNGIKMPVIGLGVYKMNAGDEMNNAIKVAYDAGYRLFDTAQMYGNEKALGDALIANGIPRSEVFLVSKVDNGNQWYQETMKSLHETLDKLQTTYLDSFLIHWPGQNKERMLSTWLAMEEAYQQGLVHSIGVCNFEISQLEFLLAHCQISPMINQIENSPLMHDTELTDYCKTHDIRIMAWAPLQRGKFNDTLAEMAGRYQKTPAQILLRWNIENGCAVIPKTVHESRMRGNLDIWDFQLSKQDLERMKELDKGVPSMLDTRDIDEIERVYAYLDDPVLTTLK